MSDNAEYGALREEILKRIEIRHNTISLTVTVAGAMLGFSLDRQVLALLYPILALVFCCIWAQNEMRELQLCDYIHTIEKKLGYGWSDYYKSVQAQGSFFRGVPLSVLVPGALFIITSVIALGIARKIMFSSVLRALISSFDIVAILMMVYFVWRVRNSRLSRRARWYHIFRSHFMK